MDRLAVGERRADAGTRHLAASGDGADARSVPARRRAGSECRAPRARCSPPRSRPAASRPRNDPTSFRTALGIGATAVIRWELGRVRVPVIGSTTWPARCGSTGRPSSESARSPRSNGRVSGRWGLRRAAGLTQRELALHLGVSVRTVAHWEAGTRPVSPAAARPLARLLRRPLPRVLAAAGLQPDRGCRTRTPGGLPVCRRWYGAPPFVGLVGRRAGTTDRGFGMDGPALGVGRPPCPRCPPVSGWNSCTACRGIRWRGSTGGRLSPASGTVDRPSVDTRSAAR